MNFTLRNTQKCKALGSSRIPRSIAPPRFPSSGWLEPRACSRTLRSVQTRAEAAALTREVEMFWLLWVIIVGLIAGWLAGKIMGTGGYGPVMDILLGIAGAIVGGFLLHLLGLYSAGGLISEIIVATIGAVFLIWLSRKLKK
jgi:uncharacterized membrane protein YeaQ/YmgE (transglycosylase-associated protein family)